MPVTYRLPVASAQVKSAVLLAGLNAPGHTTVLEAEATRDHTERMLTHFGATVRREHAGGGLTAITVVGQPELKAAHVRVPADPSSAAFPLVAALLVPGSELRIDGVMLNPTRTGLITVLKRMGADITIENERSESGETVGDLVVKASALKGVEVEPEIAPSMIDEYPILAVAAAFAEGRTKNDRPRRIARQGKRPPRCRRRRPEGLRRQNRIGRRLACRRRHGHDGMPGGGKVATHMDHRIAMSFLVAGLAAKAPVTVDDTSFVATSFPDFIPLMQKLGAMFRTAEPMSKFPGHRRSTVRRRPAKARSRAASRRPSASPISTPARSTASWASRCSRRGKDPADPNAATDAVKALDLSLLEDRALRSAETGGRRLEGRGDPRRARRPARIPAQLRRATRRAAKARCSTAATSAPSSAPTPP